MITITDDGEIYVRKKDREEYNDSRYEDFILGSYLPNAVQAVEQIFDWKHKDSKNLMQYRYGLIHYSNNSHKSKVANKRVLMLYYKALYMWRRAFGKRCFMTSKTFIQILKEEGVNYSSSDLIGIFTKVQEVPREQVINSIYVICLREGIKVKKQELRNKKILEILKDIWILKMQQHEQQQEQHEQQQQEDINRLREVVKQSKEYTEEVLELAYALR